MGCHFFTGGCEKDRGVRGGLNLACVTVFPELRSRVVALGTRVVADRPGIELAGARQSGVSTERGERGR